MKKLLSILTISSVILFFFGTPVFAGADCTGGTISYSGGNTIHTFNANSTLSCSVSGKVNVFLVGGGGGGGFQDNGGGVYPGGGGGGYTKTYSNVSISSSNTVVVGNGGAGATSYGKGGDGTYSRFGLDATYQANGGIGGSSSTVGQEPIGGNGGSGGGGAHSAGGTDGSDGTGVTGGTGQGTTTQEFGSGTVYAGGGGGGTWSGASPGGVGGGGAGSGYLWNVNCGTYSCHGTANTGGGGGGYALYGNSGPAGNGGTGIVIVRYPTGSLGEGLIRHIKGIGVSR